MIDPAFIDEGYGLVQLGGFDRTSPEAHEHSFAPLVWSCQESLKVCAKSETRCRGQPARKTSTPRARLSIPSSSKPSAAGKLWRIVSYVGHRAGAPVDAAPSLHQLLIDQVAAECREVGVAPRDDLVDLRLGVAAARLEILGEPAQDGHPLLVLPRNAQQAIVRIEEVPPAASVVMGVGCGQKSSPPQVAL